MKIRMFSKLLVILSLLVPPLTYSAIPFENYQSMVVPQPRWYPNHGFFHSYSFGLNKVSNFNLSPDLLVERTMSLNNGYYFGAAIGYRNKNFRFDEELSFRYNGVQGFETLNPPTCGSLNTVNGSIMVFSLMTNIYWDFLMGNYIMPFIGVGAGGAFLINNSTDPNVGADFTQNDIGYAFQGMVGLGIMLNFHNEIDIYYKFYQATFINYTNTVSNCDAIPAGPGVEVEFKPKYTANVIGIEWRITP